MAKIPEEQRLFELTKIERTFWESAVVVAGMDEVGRGPLAGPVVAACLVLPQAPLINGVNDSKKLSAARRESIYEQIVSLSPDYALAWVEPEVIDQINILEATKLAFKQAYSTLKQPVGDVLVDAVKGLDIPARQHSFVRGDQLSYLIAAASILAKVERDRYMVRMDELYPQYGFARNKGYGTAEHISAICEFGPCPLHRRSFIKKWAKDG
ncbi:ribonuclease HII [Eubacteriales bacterium OttesenSCG-928-K08]|nr:ribonuclease HII [Eubacteriales bacterium OttesenSCG-928-K08]